MDAEADVRYADAEEDERGNEEDDYADGYYQDHAGPADAESVPQE